MEKEAPLVSVIVPAFNCDDTIAETIQSVLDQTFSDFELIIVDDGSTDETTAIVSQFDDERIVYTRQKHQERAVARNRGISLAKGKYIAFVDADDLWLSKKLEKQLRLMETQPELGLAYCDLFYFDAVACKDIELFSRQVRLHRGKVGLHLLLKVNFIQSPTALVRRETIDQVGLFDPSLPPVEDWDMWLRIAFLAPIDYVAEPLARYRVHENMTSWVKPSWQLYDSNLRLFDKAERLYAVRSWKIRRMIRLKRALAHYDYGRAMMRKGNYDEARKCFTAAARSYPFYLPTYLRQFQSRFS